MQNMGGILQVTLTLNGLLGGVTLGLFVLGIFFKMANSTGAFYGTLLALASVVFVGIMAQFESITPMELPLSLAECACPAINSTLGVADFVPDQLAEDFNLFRVSYMWYPFMGCLLTVLFSVIGSFLDSHIKYRNVVKINNRSTIATHLQPPTALTEEPKAGVDNIAFSGNEKY